MNQRNLASIAFLAVPLAIALFSGCTVNANRAGIDFAQSFPIYSGVPATGQKTPPPFPTKSPKPTIAPTPQPTATPLFSYSGSGAIQKGPMNLPAGRHEFVATNAGFNGQDSFIVQLWVLNTAIAPPKIEYEEGLFSEVRPGKWSYSTGVFSGKQYYINVIGAEGAWTISVY